MKINAQPVRGTKDFLPNEAELRDYVQGKIADTYKQYGFQKIGTPAMEDIERLNKKRRRRKPGDDFQNPQAGAET